MFVIFQWIFRGLKWLAGAIVAPLAKLRHVRGIGRIVRYAAHALAIAVVLLLLLWVNYFFQLDTLLRTPAPVLRMVWLPLLSAFAYGLVWLGWYVCRSIADNDDPSPFPDIDKAWRQAMQTVSQAGVDVEKAPLYLIVGRPAGNTHDLIRAAGAPLATPPAPHNDPLAPLRVFANTEAIYVDCSDVSLLGRQAELLAQATALAAVEAPQRKSDDREKRRAVENADVELAEIPFGSGGDTAVQTKRSATRAETATQRGLSLVEEHVALLVDEQRPEPAEATFNLEALEELDPVVADYGAALLKDASEVETITARLQHICRLIAEERTPHVPINGVLALAPAAAADCDEAANHVGALAQQDLAAIHETTQVHCPHIVIVCDLEQTPGADELLARFPQEQRQRRLGVRLPEIVECDAAKVGEIIDESMRWLCESLLPPLVYRLIRAPQSDREDAEIDRSNTALYRFLYRMRKRRERLARILRRTAGCGFSYAGSLAGCYLAATGKDSLRQQGFAEAVFAQLPQFASSLAWTDEVLRRDRRQRLLAKTGYALLAALAAMLLAAAFAW